MGLTVAYISESKPDAQQAVIRELAERLRAKWEARDEQEARKMFGIKEPEITAGRPIA